jgi:hypothetical protein
MTHGGETRARRRGEATRACLLRPDWTAEARHDVLTRAEISCSKLLREAARLPGPLVLPLCARDLDAWRLVAHGCRCQGRDALASAAPSDALASVDPLTLLRAAQVRPIIARTHGTAVQFPMRSGATDHLHLRGRRVRIERPDAATPGRSK